MPDQRLVENDLEDIALPRHSLNVGTRDDGTPVPLPPYGINVMLAGTSGSGKSTFATSLLERLRGDLAAEADGNRSARGLLKELERDRSAAYAAAAETLSEPRYLELLDRLERETQAPVAGSRPKTRLRRVFRDELDRCQKTFDRLGRKPTDEALHRARIRVKRARYAAELSEQFGSHGGAAADAVGAVTAD